MLNLSMSGVIKSLSSPQNIYDGIIFGLKYMPTKPVAIGAAAITSGVAVYVMQPETLLNQVSTVIISSGFAWAATETTHLIASKLWEKRFAEVKAEYERFEKTAEGIESKRRVQEETQKLLDNLFADPEFRKTVGLD